MTMMYVIPRRYVLSAALVSLALLAVLFGTSRRSAAALEMTSVIVELNQAPAAFHVAEAKQQGHSVSDDELQAHRGALRTAQDQFLADLGARGMAFEVRSVSVSDVRIEFRYTLVFNGIALKVPASAIDSIEAMPQVKEVHPDDTLFTTLNGSVPYIRAPEVYGGVAELTQFDDLREGFEGQGINISIIDTGIDFPHEMFGGDATPPRLGVAPAQAAVNTNRKVIYSLPLTDIVHDGFGHGTHVASTAGGYLGFAPGGDSLPLTEDDVRLHGVAPQAKLMSYKVCSDIQSTVSQVQPIGGCDSSNIIMALEDSVSPRTINGFSKPVAHVINMSLGGSGGPDSPTAVASDNAVRAGAIVVASAGNSGPGEATVGAPAAGRRVIAVAANTKPGTTSANWSADVLAASVVNRNLIGAVTPANNLATANGFNRIKLFPMAGATAPPAGALAQYYVLVTAPQTVAGFPPSVRGRIALIKNTSGLPGGTFAQNANNAALAGAVGVILISTTENPTAVTAPIPAANILPAEGEILVDAISSTDNNNTDPPAGTISELPIRLNPFFNNTFVGEMAGFSSRGPVLGFGQVKPDVTAPGVDVLAAVPPASLLGALSAGSYGAISGTSMSSPHVAGVAALLKQAHPTWNADMIRAALINTATNLRNQSQTPKAGGLGGESVNDQGGGLVDVVEAINAKALMGVAGDGINEPTILGSHSYGEVPVVNSRVTHTSPVTVTIRDVSGQGGAYNLSLENNRDLQLAGVSAGLSATSVSVPANGSATFVVNATVDGDLIRSTLATKTVGNQTIVEPIQMQWYITATRADGGESLRMPFYLRPGNTLPATPIVTPQTLTGIVPVGDAGNSLVEGVTYDDVAFNVAPGTFRISARLDYTGQEAQDMDFQLLDPAGQVIASSGVLGGPEQLSANVTQPGTYTYRVVGFVNGPAPYTITGTLLSGPPPPTVQAITGEFVDAGGRQVDFDGNFAVSWQPNGTEQRFEIERSTDNGATWQVVGNVAAGTTSLALTNQPNGTSQFRVRGLTPGEIGFYVTAPSNVQSILVDRRALVDITNQVGTAISNVSLTGGVFQLDFRLTNNSTSTYVPLVDMNIVRINSASGTVSVINADNGGAGTSAANPARFGYSNQLGAEQEFSPGETTGARTLRFRDDANELFTFDMVVTAYQRTAGASGSGGDGGTSASGSNSSASSGASLTSLTSVLRVTVNPLTGGVQVQLVRLL